MQMLRAGGIVQQLWIVAFVLVCIIISWIDMKFIEAQSTSAYTNNRDAYDFGWFPGGVYSPGSVPSCGFCINALDKGQEPNDYYNRTVGIYRCDSVQIQELWAYDAGTNVIISSNLTPEVLCIDTGLYASLQLLKLLPCDSSKASQKWKMEGNNLVNQLSDNAAPMYFVGFYPNKNNPENMNYSTAAVLASSPSGVTPPPGFSSISEFTFLSSKNLTEASNSTTNMQALNLQGLLKVSNSSESELVNGGFELSTIQTGTGIVPSNYRQYYPSYFALCGWVIDYGPIDYVRAGFLAPAQGQFSVHLNTLVLSPPTPFSGSVSQTVRLEVEKEYELVFFMTGYPVGTISRNCNSTLYTEALLQVRVTNAEPNSSEPGAILDGDGFVRNFSSPNEVLNWVSKLVSFRATNNVTTISFISLNIGSSCGPMIDAVKLSRFKPVPTSKSKIIIVAIVAPLAVISLVATACLLSFVYRRRRAQAKEYAGLYKTENARIFSSKEIISATNKFSTVLGEGGFGTVYKAEFLNGTVGAVKVEKPRGLNSTKVVLASDEIAVLLRVHHRNLVNLIGFCIHRGRHMLVFEYLPNGSLHDRLHRTILSVPRGESFRGNSRGLREHSQEMMKPLSWIKRVKIACDVAYGLEYLHHDANPPIVHRDVKSQNILLTATDSAKLADFGLSKAAPVDAKSFQSVETMVRGSFGYLDPQYFLTGLFSAKSDVYSYGIVLLELISGHQAIYRAASLLNWAAPFLTDPSLYPELVDKNLNGEFDRDQLEAMVTLLKMCTLEDGKQRPNMRQVQAFLSTNQLAMGNSDSVESGTAILSREEYQKMHTMFIDAGSSGRTDELNTGSREEILLAMPHHVPQPRD